MELSHCARREGRLSSFLRGELKMSEGLVNRLKWQERLLVNGQPEHTNYPVKPGDVITVLLDEPEPEYPAEDGELTVLYEDLWILAVDKPAGMLIHPSHAKNEGTLANYVAGYYRKTGQNSAFHPLTRLDRDTFGVVLLGKNSHVHSLLQSCGAVKTYHALVFGGPKEDRGIIDAPIARCPLPSLLRQIRGDGKPSVTEFRVLERNEKLCKLELHPITGRTHQLRLHMAAIGHPLAGDWLYGQRQPEIQRPALHSAELKLRHPITGESIQLHSSLPEDMKKLMYK